MFNKLFWKKWMDSSEFLEKYVGGGAYSSINIGDQYVNVDDIIALSLPYEEVIQDFRVSSRVDEIEDVSLVKENKMEKLKELVIENGWEDYPGIFLTLAPNGRYSVTGGGNRRSVLSNELGIKKIKASVDVAVPENYFTEDELIKKRCLSNVIADFRRQEFEIRNERNDLYGHVHEFGQFFFEQRVKFLEGKINNLIDERNAVEKILEDLCVEIAYRENLIPDEFRLEIEKKQKKV